MIRFAQENNVQSVTNTVIFCIWYVHKNTKNNFIKTYTITESLNQCQYYIGNDDNTTTE